MCKKNEAIGTAFMALGAGMILSVLISSGVWTVVIGIVAVAVGCLLAKKR